jgi:hypothetical protein
MSDPHLSPHAPTPTESASHHFQAKKASGPVKKAEILSMSHQEWFSHTGCRPTGNFNIRQIAYISFTSKFHICQYTTILSNTVIQKLMTMIRGRHN